MKFVRLLAGCLLLELGACATQNDPLSNTSNTVSLDQEALAAKKRQTTRVEPPKSHLPPRQPHEMKTAQKPKLAGHRSSNTPAPKANITTQVEEVALTDVGRIDSWQTIEVSTGSEPNLPPGVEVVDVPYLPPVLPEVQPQAGTMQPVYEAEDFAPPALSLQEIVGRGLGFGARLQDQWVPTHHNVPSVTQHHYDESLARALAQAAGQRTDSKVRYDGRYVEIGYPWGDVPPDMGVCTDVIVRSYRALGIDLQQLVHEDMKRAFWAYPSQRIYGLDEPDSNIDHRRVVNLEVFFKRHGLSLPVSMDPGNYRPGDLVTWRISGKQPHIGIVIGQRDEFSDNRLVVHNIGAGPEAGDILFVDEPVGHFRFTPSPETRLAQR